MSGTINTSTALPQESHPRAPAGDCRMASLQGRRQPTSAITRRPYGCLYKALLIRMFVALVMHCITGPILRMAITRMMRCLELRHVSA
jgi:hypothetical protein